MKLGRLRIKDFRCIEDFDLDLSKKTILFGAVGKGKSTVKAAVHMALFGWCEWTDKRGAGFKNLIRLGQKRCSINLEVDKDGQHFDISVKLGSKKVIEIIDGDGVVTTSLPWEGHERIAALMCAMPDVFLEDTEFGGMLSDMLTGPGIDPEQVFGIAGDNEDWLREQLKAEVTWSAKSLTVFGEDCYEKRTDWNRELKGEKLLQESRCAVHPVNDKGKKLDIDEIASYEAHIGKLRRKLSDLEGMGGTTSVITDEMLQEALSVEAHAKEAMDKHGDFDNADLLAKAKEVDKIEIAVDSMQEFLDELRGLQECPTCRQHVSQEHKGEISQSIEERIAIQSEALNAGNATYKERLSKQQAHAAKASALHTTWMEAKIITGKLTDELEVQAAIPADIPAEIEKTQASITNGEGLVVKMKSHRDYLSAEAWIEITEAEVLQLTWAIKQFKEGEFIKTVATDSDSANEFTESVNDILGTFGNYRLRIGSKGKAMDFLLWSQEADGEVSISECSQGQQTMVQAAVAFALSGGSAVVMLDNLNTLHPESRGKVLRFASKYKGAVLLASSWQRTEAEYQEFVSKATQFQCVQMGEIQNERRMDR